MTTYKDIKITSQIRKSTDIEGILFTVTGFIYRPGTIKIKYQLEDNQYKDFMLFMATTIAATVINAIDNQRYKYKWKPLSINYMAFKKRHNLSLKIWEATGHMKESIRVFKRGKYIAVGFDNRAVYPKSYIQVNLIARFLEFGSRDNAHPPSRPLWRPLHIYVRKNIDRYYEAYKKELKVANKQYLLLKR